MCAPPLLVSLPLTRGRFIEDRQAFDRGERPSPVPPDDPDGIALDDPFDLIARPNPEAVRDRLRHRDLELTGDLGHVLTLARATALIKHGILRHLSPGGVGSRDHDVQRLMLTDSLATELLEALDRNRLMETISGRDSSFDSAAAYEVSAEIFRRRRARGERPAGRKIGFTNRLIWDEYRVSSPMWGYVYDRTVTWLDEPVARLAVGHLCQPRIEPEVVLHFASAPGSATDEVELLSTIDWIAHGFEIVQTHFLDWKFTLADTIADFGLHGALVVGPPCPVSPGDHVVSRLRAFAISLARDGVVQAHGAGANVLDSPLMAALHLLRVLREQRLFEPVQAGEIVTTGTLTPALPIRAGETWTTNLSGIDLPGLSLRVE